MTALSFSSPQSYIVLLIDPSDRNRELIANSLSAHAIRSIEAKNGLTGWQTFLAREPSALIAAVNLPGLQGLELLDRVRAHATTPIIFHSAPNDSRAAVAFLKAGADDFFFVPDEIKGIGPRLRVLLDHHNNFNRAAIQSAIIGRSPSIARVREKLAAVVQLRIPVLVRGEAGSGLDHLVRTIASAADNCKSLVTVRPETTRPPVKGDIGRIVYLDRVEHLSLPDQVQWLQQIEKCEQREKDAPHRVLASTTSDLQELAASKKFDLNLANRLTQFSIDMPSLRERSEDIGLLTRHLAARISRRLGRPRVVITAPAIRLLQTRIWHGNVRELEVIVQKLVAFSADARITRRSVLHVLAEAPYGLRSLRLSEERRQRDELIAMLDATGGNLAETARRMGMSRGAIIYRAQKFGLLAKRTATGIRSRPGTPSAPSRPLRAEG